MRITPLEIRQKTFEKIFRGYDKDEVTAFLTLLSQEWEKINDEKKMLEMKYEQSQKESEKLRQVEASLFRTLKSAEDTGAVIIEEANKTAELILNEARTKAEALKADFEKQANLQVEEAESKRKAILDRLSQDVSALVESYETLWAQREIVVKNLKNIASETFETVNLAEEELQHVDIAAHARAVEELDKQDSAELRSDTYNEEKQTIVTEAELEEEEIIEDEPEPADQLQTVEEIPAKPPMDEPDQVPGEKERKKESGSFFDQFD